MRGHSQQNLYGTGSFLRMVIPSHILLWTDAETYTCLHVDILLSENPCKQEPHLVETHQVQCLEHHTYGTNYKQGILKVTYILEKLKSFVLHAAVPMQTEQVSRKQKFSLNFNNISHILPSKSF